jgi:hypothetical protein
VSDDPPQESAFRIVPNTDPIIKITNAEPVAEQPAHTVGQLTADQVRRALNHTIPPPVVPLPPVTLEQARKARDILDDAGLLLMLDAVVRRAENTGTHVVQVANEVVAMHQASLDRIAEAFEVPTWVVGTAKRPPKERRRIILDTAEDAGVNFIYYDRKESEGLPDGEIEAAVTAGEITRAEILDAFSRGMGGRW